MPETLGPDNPAPSPPHYHERVVYKTVGDAELCLYVYHPPPSSTRPAPGIVFFFGGGWQGGQPGQFGPQCLRLAERGWWAATADYRVFSRHGTTPFEAIADARSAMRFIHKHASELGVAPHRVAAGGGSAGGHLAACAAFIDAFDELDEDQSIPAEPAALALLNPVLNTFAEEWLGEEGQRQATKLLSRFGDRGKEGSPLHHVRPDGPPTVIMHGDADETVPIEHAEAFCQAMLHAGNTCNLIRFKGEGHGFFNYHRCREMYQRTMGVIEEFLRAEL